MKTYLKYLEPEEIIKRLKNGEIIRNDEDGDIIKYYDGVIYSVYEDGTCGINEFFTTDLCLSYYFETDEKPKEKTEEHFEIKGRGLYKTRDGRKAFVSNIYIDDDGDDEVLGIIDGEEELMCWELDGFRMDRKKPNEVDIISKWED